MALRTPLYEKHVAENARIVDFAGWDMPVQYESIPKEHKQVREGVGIFDVSHMGRFFFSGTNVGEELNQFFVSNVRDLLPGNTKYTLVCKEDGGVLDDVLVTCLDESNYMVVVNASNREKLLVWFKKHLSPSITFEDRTKDIGMVAIQGEQSPQVVQAIMKQDFSDLDYYSCKALGGYWYVSRTGYTGEDGFEIIAPNKRMPEVWDKARENGCAPVGLGARDTLRLEMGFPLYGHELSEEITPLEALLKWTIDFEAGDFIGKDALLKQMETGIPRRRLAFTLEGKGIPRADCKIFDEEESIGSVTSGGFSPVLNKGIGLALVQNGRQKSDNLFVQIRNRKIPINRVKIPFVKKKVKK